MTWHPTRGHDRRGATSTALRVPKTCRSRPGRIRGRFPAKRPPGAVRGQHGIPRAGRAAGTRAPARRHRSTGCPPGRTRVAGPASMTSRDRAAGRAGSSARRACTGKAGLHGHPRRADPAADHQLATGSRDAMARGCEVFTTSGFCRPWTATTGQSRPGVGWERSAVAVSGAGVVSGRRRSGSR